MKTQYKPHPVSVRQEFSDESIWRDALGAAEPLFVFSALEPHLDAPEIMPAGSTRSTKYGPYLSPSWRWGV